ncbi:hypothetical protein AZE42_10504 [Rhizopogon vesiculosus]|uniref:Uncharacterized protein n=1 Tax=Rhizopogon vesiculosus TaxID=180088 RepID=A0A1J8Q289_9AGAM|nr:hypothetical protein AZE42_10504 [Rhizopogon vesiculosus]
MNDIRDTLDGTVTLRLNSLTPARGVSRTLEYICGGIRTYSRPVWKYGISCPFDAPYALRTAHGVGSDSASFVSRADKVCGLDGMTAKHEKIRAEVVAFRDLVHSDTRTLQSQLRNMGSSMGQKLVLQRHFEHIPEVS